MSSFLFNQLNLLTKIGCRGRTMFIVCSQIFNKKLGGYLSPQSYFESCTNCCSFLQKGHHIFFICPLLVTRLDLLQAVKVFLQIGHINFRSVTFCFFKISPLYRISKILNKFHQAQTFSFARGLLFKPTLITLAKHHTKSATPSMANKLDRTFFIWNTPFSLFYKYYIIIFRKNQLEKQTNFCC